MSNLRKDIEARLKTLKEIENEGINPYPHIFKPTVEVSEIVSNPNDFLGKKVKIAGRVMSVRKHGKLIFCDIVDNGYKIQIMSRLNELGEEKFKKFDRWIEKGDFIGIEGEVIRTKRGELTVLVTSFKILAKSLISLPDQWFGLKDVDERYRKRYLDIILNKKIRENFEKRFKLIDEVRNFFKSKGFVEVDTPTLQPVYGGAYAKPFITHVNYLDEDWYLRISDELYLKRMIIAGFNKVFEICKDFRNESVDVKHNPEFTMIEAYQAYADYNDMMKIVEELFDHLTKVFGIEKVKRIVDGKEYEINLKPPFRRITIFDAIREYLGIDPEKVSDEKIKEILKANEIEVKPYNRGLALTEIFDELVSPKFIQPTFALDYPIESTPLAKPHRSKPGLVERFELFIGGIEFANAYTELNNPIIQNRLFKQQAEMRDLGFEEAHQYDEDFIEAMMYGMPPTGGLGIGIDRLVMLFTENYSIKEAILWPMMKKEKERREAVVILDELTSKD